MWRCGFGCYDTFASKFSCAMHEERCWMNPARKPFALLPRGILPGDRVGYWSGGYLKKTTLLAYTNQGAYVWTFFGTAFVDADRLTAVTQ
jgi:hypothetical protein